MNQNKLYNPTKMQRIVLAFWNDQKEVIRLATPERYSNVFSFRGSLAQAIKRMELPIIIRVIKGSVYLIKEQAL